MAKMAPIVIRPIRDPDYTSKRGVPYWWSPDWVRGNGSASGNYGRIKPIKEKDGEVYLYMKSKAGNLTKILGSIQQEFRQWHLDRQIDYILLGGDIDELLNEE
jgi:hypothetical protein